MKEGVKKEGNAGVYAKKVFDIVPLFQVSANEHSIVMCDDEILEQD